MKINYKVLKIIDAPMSANIESADFIGEHLSYDLSNLEFRFIKFIKCKFISNSNR